MAISETNEKRFEQDIETFLISKDGGYAKGSNVYDPAQGVYINALINFIKNSQPKAWARFEMQNPTNTEQRFCTVFNNACDMHGALDVLRNGFKHRGIAFKVCYFKPEHSLTNKAIEQYNSNVCECYRQWYYSTDNGNSVDLVLVVNGIPVFAFELKNQYTGQSVDNAKRQWMFDRDPREVCFQFNKRVLAFFCVDQMEAWMATKLNGKNTYFLPFNQGDNGAGNDGGAGNPPNPDGYMTSYIWENVFQKDSMMDIVQKFIHLQVEEEKSYDEFGAVSVKKKQALIFPRYHQLDVVRKLVVGTRQNGAGNSYLIQHSAGSGKSNSIAWVCYRLGSLFDENDNPMFSSVIVVTDRRNLNSQLQETISSFDHTFGAVTAIGDKDTSKKLREAINEGDRIIVTTLQRFPVIHDEVEKRKGSNYAIIIDEAHSSQTGSSAKKLKESLADIEDALAEYALIEGKDENELDIKKDVMLTELVHQGKHKNLSFYAFTATPKGTTLEMFGTEREDGSFHPFHVYSMRQAIEECFILDVLRNYMTYHTYFKIAKKISENPDIPVNYATKEIMKFKTLHPYNLGQKARIIVETFRNTTKNAIGGKGKMMVVTSSRLAAVRYYHEIKRYIEEMGYADVEILAAFSGTVKDGSVDYTEPSLNVRKDGSHISENQTKTEFHENFDLLIVAEKYQTGFDEPLLHSMVVDKKLRGVKAVQTLSRLNRIYPGKKDTFVLDFANKVEDIKDAFQPFYQEAYLTEEVNTDLLYKLQKEIADFKVYGKNDIEKLCIEYFKPGKQDSTALGRMTSILKPVADRYNEIGQNERYLFRRKIRGLVKWYEYISQVTRMFDEDIHKEYVFCSYLIKLLPREDTEVFDLEGKLQLEFFKLKEAFSGNIGLEQEPAPWEPANPKDRSATEVKSPLDEIIDKINEKYKGVFTGADRVLLEALHVRLMNDKQLVNMANKADSKKMFVEAFFPAAFDEAAQESYTESTETYTELFKDRTKYQAFMSALAEVVYRDIKKESAI